MGDDRGNICVQEHRDIWRVLQLLAIRGAEIWLGTPLRTFHVNAGRIESGRLKPERSAKVLIRNAGTKMEHAIRPVIKWFEFRARDGPSAVGHPASLLQIEVVQPQSLAAP